MSAQVLRHNSRDALVAAAVRRFERTVADTLQHHDVVRVALTGGTVGIAMLAALRSATVDWQRVHCYWGDERFVPSASPDRNALQAREALLDHIAIPEANIHELPASDADLDLDQAAVAATYEYDHVESFDIVLLGMGPDAHVASLFPQHEGASTPGEGVIAVRDSPKPPPERLSLTRTTINEAARVWLVVAGEDKAEALSKALSSSDHEAVPAAGVHGTLETLFFVDDEAASLL